MNPGFSNSVHEFVMLEVRAATAQPCYVSHSVSSAEKQALIILFLLTFADTCCHFKTEKVGACYINYLMAMPETSGNEEQVLP
jgi:hypothetical protein